MRLVRQGLQNRRTSSKAELIDRLQTPQQLETGSAVAILAILALECFRKVWRCLSPLIVPFTAMQGMLLRLLV